MKFQVLALIVAQSIFGVAAHADIEGVTYRPNRRGPQQKIHYKCISMDASKKMSFDGGVNETSGTLTIGTTAVKMSCGNDADSENFPMLLKNLYAQPNLYCIGDFNGTEVLLAMTNSMGAVQVKVLRVSTGAEALLNCVENNKSSEDGGWN